MDYFQIGRTKETIKNAVNEAADSFGKLVDNFQTDLLDVINTSNDLEKRIQKLEDILNRIDPVLLDIKEAEAIENSPAKLRSKIEALETRIKQLEEDKYNDVGEEKR